MSKEVKAINKMIRTSSQKLNLIVKDIRKKDINSAQIRWYKKWKDRFD